MCRSTMCDYYFIFLNLQTEPGLYMKLILNVPISTSGVSSKIYIYIYILPRLLSGFSVC